MIVIICGGLGYSDRRRVYRVLDEIHAKTPIEEIRMDSFDGAERLASHWACNRGGISVCTFTKIWMLFGESARPIDLRCSAPKTADLLIAFPGEDGTRSMIEQAREAGIPVMDLEDKQMSLL